ncbi:MAG: hypothetical protein ABEN55_12200 [Bradymonadaceae bacterium]
MTEKRNKNEPEATDGTADDKFTAVKIFSMMPYAYSIPVRLLDDDGRPGTKVADIVLTPGKNFVTERVWEHIMAVAEKDNDKRLLRRVEKFMEIDDEPKKVVKQALAGQPGSEWIEELSDKSRPIEGAQSKSEELPEEDIFVQGKTTLDQKVA